MAIEHLQKDAEDWVRTEYDREARRRRRRMVETANAYIRKELAEAHLSNEPVDIELVSRNALYVATNGKLGDEPAIEGVSSAQLGS